MFAIKSSLRAKVSHSLSRYLIISERYIRGRPRSEVFNESNETRQKFLEEEHFDHQLDHEKNHFNQRDNFPRQDFYDSRNNQSFNKFERAKYGVTGRQYHQNDNQRDRFQTNKTNQRRYEMNDNSYDKSYNKPRSDYQNFKEKDFNNRRQRKNEMNGNYDNSYNRSANDYRDFKGKDFDNRRQRNENPNYNTNRYNRKQSEEYQNYKYRNQINEFSSKDNAIYNNEPQFDFDGQKPRFSRLRENEIRENKKFKRFQSFDEKDNKIDINLEDIENTESDEREEKKRKDKIPLPFVVTSENRFEVLNQIVTPLHLKPYDIQLSIKYKNQTEILRNLGRKLKLVNSPVVCDSKGLPCPLELVKPSPLTERYRSKDEFSIWPGVDGFNKTLGFFIGQPSINENVVCVEPDHIIVSRESHLSIAKKFQKYLKEVTPYDSCQNYGEGGHWRRFHIRSNTSGQHMVSAIMHPQELNQQELDQEMQRLRDYFEDDQRITSMYFQPSRHTRLSNEKEPFIHLFGDQTITETLFDKKFLISVDSFFQINTSAAEVLYRNVMSELNLSRNTTVLDICCGTGALATIIAPNVCRVIGIDSSVSAINDAQKNAALNNVRNATFIVGPVEQKLPQLMDELYSQDIVVVANPTRAGLHSSVINALREINFIRKLVYVSCKPEGKSLKNFLHLCVPANKQSKHLGPAFVPTNAIPVDLFPHTNHCELILTFERF